MSDIFRNCRGYNILAESIKWFGFITFIGTLALVAWLIITLPNFAKDGNNINVYHLFFYNHFLPCWWNVVFWSVYTKSGNTYLTQPPSWIKWNLKPNLRNDREQDSTRGLRPGLHLLNFNHPLRSMGVLLSARDARPCFSPISPNSRLSVSKFPKAKNSKKLKTCRSVILFLFLVSKTFKSLLILVFFG